MASLREIRPARPEDMEDMLAIIESARNYMRATGNLSQWSDKYPGIEDIKRDIERNNCYVGVDDQGEIFMTFAFIPGEDPTYKIIKDGNWLNDKPYGTIHRIASNGKISRVLEKACDYCFKKTDNIRIDTHADNRPMLLALNRLGFKRCGIINCRDGSPRIAFQKSNRTQ